MPRRLFTSSSESLHRPPPPEGGLGRVVPACADAPVAARGRARASPPLRRAWPGARRPIFGFERIVAPTGRPGGRACSAPRERSRPISRERPAGEDRPRRPGCRVDVPARQPAGHLEAQLRSAGRGADGDDGAGLAPAFTPGRGAGRRGRRGSPGPGAGLGRKIKPDPETLHDARLPLLAAETSYLRERIRPADHGPGKFVRLGTACAPKALTRRVEMTSESSPARERSACATTSAGELAFRRA
jgi:hypothetical protein